MGLTSHEDFKDDIHESRKRSLPDWLSNARGIGGVALGVAMGTKNIDSSTAFVAASLLAVTDMEGSLIKKARDFPARIRDFFWIYPTKRGEKLDVANDKLFGVSVITGGVVGGMMPAAAGLILAPELITVGATAYAKKMTGEDPHASKIGKAGMIGRFTTISAYLAGAATQGHETISEGLTNIGHAGVVVSIGLGLASAYKLVSDARSHPNFIARQNLEPKTDVSLDTILDAQPTAFMPVR